MLEVMVEAISPDEVVIFHVMEARAKHLRRMNREDGTDEH